jgi:hypothetical protein
MKNAVQPVLRISATAHDRFPPFASPFARLGVPPSPYLASRAGFFLTWRCDNVKER